MTARVLKRRRRDNRIYYYLHEVNYTKKEGKREYGKLLFLGGYNEKYRGAATLKDIAEYGNVNDILQVTLYYLFDEFKVTPLFDRGENILFAKIAFSFMFPNFPDPYKAMGIDPTEPLEKRTRALFRKTIEDHKLENEKAIGINLKTHDPLKDGIIKMDKDGRIKLPKWVISSLNLESGEEMQLDVGRERGEIVIKMNLRENKSLFDYETSKKD